MNIVRQLCFAGAVVAAIPAAAIETPPPVSPRVEVLPAPAPAAPAPAAATNASATPVEPGERLLCRRQEVVGSLIKKKRVCQTAANWARQSKTAQDELQLFTAPGAYSPNGPGGQVTDLQGSNPFPVPR